MTAKANHSTPGTSCPSPLVLFGIDSRGKPKAARFGKNTATLALKAATQLQLRTIAGDDPKIADIAARLPKWPRARSGDGFSIRRCRLGKAVRVGAEPAAPEAG